jgi:ADP-ribosyl-[dinitrogen reductase] hydrolase
MRSTPVAIAFASAGRDATMDAARRVSGVTHGDRVAGEGCAIYCELVRVALDGDDPLAAVSATLELIDEPARGEFARVLDERWQPGGTDANGAVWGALGTAVWALRRSSSFAEAVVLAIDTGDDADTVGCITGGLAGAVYGIGAIPIRWASPIHGSVVGPDDSGHDLASLRDLAAELAGLDRDTPPDLPTWSPRGPHLVDERGLWVADREGASKSHEVVSNAHVISLSKVAHAPLQPHWRRAYLVDSEDPDENLAIEAVLDDVLSTVRACVEAGEPVIVHCYAGESRTGLVLRAWLMERDSLTEAEATAKALELWPHLKTWNTAFTDLLRRRERSGTVPRGGRS